MVAFFDCHLKKDEKTCQYIYGKEKTSLCGGRNKKRLTYCIFSKNESKAIKQCRKTHKISFRSVQKSQKALIASARDHSLKRCLEVAECH